MKGVSMDDWFTVQLFISEDGVCEVAGHVDDYRKLRCTCSEFTSKGRCKHVKHMRKQMDEAGGSVTIKVPEKATDEEIDHAMSGAKFFRELVIKYGKIEYLP